jgi:hypothetical protein
VTCFWRDEKVWMTCSAGGDDELPEFPVEDELDA